MSSNIPGTAWEERYLGGGVLEESKVIRELAEATNTRQEKLRRQDHKTRPCRGFQAKGHAGIAYARFAVSPDVPDELQHGIFVPGKAYSAVVRFSSAAGSVRHDQLPDLHGLAVRVYVDSSGKEKNEDFLESTGTEVIQDLLATSAPLSHTRDAREFMIYSNADVSNSKIGKFVSMFIRSPKLALRARKIFRKYVDRPVNSLADETYWSRTPFAIGDVAVKFRLKPQVLQQYRVRQHDNFNGLREELSDRLRIHDVVYDVEIQRFVSSTSTPIEDATVAWNSPWEKLAELHISKRDIDSATALRIQLAIDKLEFNPWHSPGKDDFRPLGSLNRARRLAYDASADFRKGRRTQEVGSSLQVLKYRVAIPVFRLVNKVFPWYVLAKISTTLPLINLSLVREYSRQTNLYDVPNASPEPKTRPTMRQPPDAGLAAREANGTNNDITDPDMGKRENLFSRNIKLKSAVPDPSTELLPDPRKVSLELMTRDEFQPIPHLNLLAAAWIQFQVHGWFNHRRAETREERDDVVRLPLAENDPFPGKGSPRAMEIIRTPVAERVRVDGSQRELSLFRNTETSWWDGSQLYGSCHDRQKLLRERDGAGAKLKIEDIGYGPMLPEDPDTISDDEPQRGVDLTGFNDNYWIGLSLLHTLFALEHNAVCDALKDAYGDGLDDEQRFQIARLVIAALMAKIHTIEWSPSILHKPSMIRAFDAYWWGLAGVDVWPIMKKLSSHEVLHGLPGSDTTHHAVPYEMTEEFVSVYRLHPLLPDDFAFVDLDGSSVADLGLGDVTGENSRPSLEQVGGFENALYTFGLRNPGALTLFNFPKELQQHRRIRKKGELEQTIDVAALDIFRDRERGIPRYNDFRQQLGLPRVRSFADLVQIGARTESETAPELAQRRLERAEKLRKVYPGGIDTVDAMVGMFAETPPHEGFGISEPAYRVFLVMAARRQLSDRFFTSHYRPDVYTELGMEWIDRTTLKTMLLRHYPKLAPALQDVDNVFGPWGRS